MSGFSEGDRVFHFTLGPGVVTSANDPITLESSVLPCIRVQFATGRSHRYGELWFERYPHGLMKVG
jgi:hypothetical protein